ncbi:branched-chain amino acid ABC transporter permease [Halorientalis marina]|jgi:branched-chain amino acid transport system permease protein|uniref:branched-chain amino acid ABC transporter permease n=1 Tax=Halorientalis marina TaxID=2931976 RepID=UPI001FF584A4|nr:branched-chain amino acid ABC transporter permease [Halorientalis marina]
MVDVLTIAVQAIIISALYALVAVGFTLIFGVGGVLNLAHGASITIGAFAAYFAMTSYGLGIVGAFAAAAIVPAVFGGILYLGVIRQFQDEPIIVMILTLVTSVAVEAILVTTQDATSYTLPVLVPGTVDLAGATIQITSLVMFAISWLILIALFLYVNKTDTGRAIIATSMDRKGAFLVGIDSGRINLLMWVLAGALAGLAGLFLAQQFGGAAWDMGRTPLVLSFAIVVIGGLGSIRGSVIGAYIIGTIEVLTVNLVNAELQGLMPLLVLVAVLLLRPEGLFGQEVETT